MSDNEHVLYEQVCKQHDEIADFRAKLLALLPIASGAGIFLLLNQDLYRNGVIPPSVLGHLYFVGLFGIVVTLGLFIHELHGIHKCERLINAAKKLEIELSNKLEGAFGSKPHRTWGVNEPMAAIIIYPAVAGAWAYIATVEKHWQFGTLTICELVAALVTFGVLFGFGAVFTLWAKYRDK